jgi:hypothetical protein
MACFRHDDPVDASSGAFARLSRKGIDYCVPSFLLIERPTLKPLCYRFEGAGASDFAGDRGAFCK